MAGYDYKIDPTTGDLDLSNAEIEFVAGSDQVRQAVNIGLAIDQGEWFENIEAGVPWLNTILSQRDTKPFMDAFIIFYLKSQFEDIDDVVDYRSTIDILGNVDITFRATLINGEELTIQAGAI